MGDTADSGFQEKPLVMDRYLKKYIWRCASISSTYPRIGLICPLHICQLYLAHLWTDFQSCLLLFALLQKIKEILLPPVGNWATVCTFENIFTPWVLVLKIPSFKTVALPPKIKNGKVEKQFAQILIYTLVFSGDLNFLPLLLIPTSSNWKLTMEARWWTTGL